MAQLCFKYHCIQSKMGFEPVKGRERQAEAQPALVDETNFGQIEIYNRIFADATPPTISPTQCLYGKLSYCGLWNKKRLPVMIGSKLHVHDDNPLNIKGYFIIDGLCKSISMMYIMNGTLFTKDRAYLSDGRRISIVSMGKYIVSYRGKEHPWYLPINYEDIAACSVDQPRLLTHLQLVADATNDDLLTPHVEHVDAMILCYMFENWLGIADTARVSRRLVTPGEMIRDAIEHQYDVLKFFRTHRWAVRNIQNVTSVSEDMKHYSMIGDIESIRRITYPTSRENMRMKDRYVKDNERRLICPVQTSDGSLCGTILYLTAGARVSEVTTGELKTGPGTKLFFVDGKYSGTVGKVTIPSNAKGEALAESYEDDRIVMVWTAMGRILPGHSDVSVAATYIPYRSHNPAIRAMFATSMIKQALTCDPRLDLPFNDTKRLLSGEQPKVGPAFPYAAGWNLTVAIMPWFGYNIEDALVISKSTSKKYLTEKIMVYRAELVHQEDRILHQYVRVDDKVSKGDVLFKVFRPTALVTLDIVRSSQDGVVTSVIDHKNCFTVVVSKFRALEVGDKMCSRHGQKGVVSLIVDDAEMPTYYDGSSWRPIDLLINPHAFPTRMTWGQILEMGNTEVFVRVGSETLPNKILVGPCYYMALRHQVADKLQYRDTHSIDSVSLQAIAGKARSGGLRFGHMERDVLIATGSHALLDELYSIDRTSITVCNECGKLGQCQEHSSQIQTVSVHQYLLICTGLLRVHDHDIRYWPATREYAIVPYDVSTTPRVDDIHFGEYDPLDVRHHEHKGQVIPVLPMILRSPFLHSLYTRLFTGIHTKSIVEEHKRLLFGKNGAYHKFCEGHRVNHCLRSVIVPGPDLPLDTVEIPFGSDIGRTFGILNRQPTLSYRSIMSVKLRVGSTRCIRFNPQLCEAFNADFDGDEMCIFGTERFYDDLPIISSKIQDYILGNLETVTKMGLTANQVGIELMVRSGSKGKPHNVEHLFKRIGPVLLDGKVAGTIESCYSSGLNNDEWYLQAKAAREGAASIGVNTPFTGELNAICNRMYI